MRTQIETLIQSLTTQAQALADGTDPARLGTVAGALKTASEALMIVQTIELTDENQKLHREAHAEGQGELGRFLN
jgi:hypothetical protein